MTANQEPTPLHQVSMYVDLTLHSLESSASAGTFCLYNINSCIFIVYCVMFFDVLSCILILFRLMTED